MAMLTCLVRTVTGRLARAPAAPPPTPAGCGAGTATLTATVWTTWCAGLTTVTTCSQASPPPPTAARRTVAGGVGRGPAAPARGRVAEVGATVTETVTVPAVSPAAQTTARIFTPTPSHPTTAVCDQPGIQRNMAGQTDTISTSVLCLTDFCFLNLTMNKFTFLGVLISFI